MAHDVAGSVPPTPPPASAHPGYYPSQAASREQVAYPVVGSYAIHPAQPAKPGTPTIAVVGLVLAFVMPLVGFVTSLVALSRSKVTGAGRGLAIAGIVVSIAVLAVSLIAAIPVYLDSNGS